MTASIRSDGDPAASRANRVVVWSPEYLSYRWSADHPMNPTRLDLTMALSRSLGLLEGIEFLEPSAASDADLLRIHTPAYLAAVKDAGNSANNGVSGQDVPHGLGTEDNPVFPHMHEASAILAGGSLAALEKADAKVEPVLQITGGTLETVSCRPLREIKGYRVMFDVVPAKDDSSQIDLRLYLRYADAALSETWLYQFSPPPLAERRLY